MRETLEVELPYGLELGGPERERRVVVGQVTGRAQLESTGATDDDGAALALVGASVLRVGNHEAGQLPSGWLARFAPVDLDYLCVQLARLIGSDQHFVTLEHEDCGERLDLGIDLGTVEFDEVPGPSELTSTFPCPTCGADLTFQLVPRTVLLGRAQSSRARILREIHTLAYHYHWSLDDILDMPRPLRLEFIELLDEQLDPERNSR